MNKNEVATITISDMGTNGEGIGRCNGYTLFVKDAVVGDEVEVKIMKAKKNYGYARLLQVVKPSKDRVEPKCPIAKQCGGCQLQALKYEKQLEFKENKVRQNLEKIGEIKNVPMLPIIGMENPFRYRNKAQFPIGENKDGKIITGFYAGRTHQIIPNMDCLLGVEVNQRILEIVIAHMERHQIKAYNEATQTGLVRHVLIRYGFVTKEIMVCLIMTKGKLPYAEELVNRLQSVQGMKSIMLNVNSENTNVIMGKECKLLLGDAYITDYIGEVKYQISPLSFYQVNPVQTEKLYGTALDFAELTGEEVVWDLYCGIGTISLFLAQRAKQVYGVEIVPQAIEDAKVNAELNGIKNAEFFVGKAEKVLPEKYQKEKIYADVIVVDPPRKGCEVSVLDTMLKMKPKRIVYVSCDSATLGRDLKYLCENGGYEVKKVRTVDMFGMGVHCESIVLLTKTGM